MPTLSVTAWSCDRRAPRSVRVSPKGMEAKAASAKKTDTNGASTNSSRSARAGMKSSFVSILMASARGWSSPRTRMPKIEARLAPMRSCMIADCLRSTQVRMPPRFSTTNIDEGDGAEARERGRRPTAHDPATSPPSPRAR